MADELHLRKSTGYENFLKKGVKAYEACKKKNYTVKQNRIKQSVGSRVFDVFLYLFMVAFTFCMVYPFWNQLVISLNEGSDTVLGGITFWPRKFTLQNYIYIFQRQNLPKGAAMSVARCVVGTFTSIVCTALLGLHCNN